jgi:hypothetical protein
MTVMKKSSGISPMRWLAGPCSLAVLMMLPRTGAAQQRPATGVVKTDVSRIETVPLSALMPGAPLTRPVAQSTAEEEESPKPNSAGHQGVKVHGHWVLQVKNPDGSLGDRREFENSLTTVGAFSSGDQVLGLLLSGNASVGDPAIVFSNNVTAGVDPSTECFLSTFSDYQNFVGGTPACGVLTTTHSMFHSPNALSWLSPNSVDQTGLTAKLTLSPAVKWVLSGTYTVVDNQTQIGTVETLIEVCQVSTLDPGNNPTGTFSFGGTFTDRQSVASSSVCDTDHVGNTLTQLLTAMTPATLTSTIVPNGPVSVTPGQLVQVTVTISFS